MSTTVRCTDCKTKLPLQVCKSEAGFYVGRICPECGPYSNEGWGYYKESVMADKELESMEGKTRSIELELNQQKFNNKHNLSIDQQVSDRIENLEKRLVLSDTLYEAQGLVLKSLEAKLLNAERESEQRYQDGFNDGLTKQRDDR